ncbi:MAG: YigZ family protein [Mollicutes bacterium]|nr:YigZ family protein [Mollicutes bacterium]
MKLVIKLQLINKREFIIKKSRFIGLYYQVNDINQIDEILNNVKKEYKKAHHFPYAYKIGNNIKKSDDKEPSNTAGMPIYNIIIKNNLDNVLIIIVRYYGGIKLGVGPLARAYLNTANSLLN